MHESFKKHFFFGSSPFARKKIHTSVMELQILPRVTRVNPHNDHHGDCSSAPPPQKKNVRVTVKKKKALDLTPLS